MHTVAVLALDGVVPFDLATPLDVFGRARLPDGRAAYRLKVCAPGGGAPGGGAPGGGDTGIVEADGSIFGLRAPWGLDALAEADTIILPGVGDVVLPDEARAALRAAAASGTRIASICVGAFLLAQTGLLDGLRATTHWVAADEFARRFPAVDVDPNVLFVDNGQILTSAGAAAGLDLCLHMIRTDLGVAVAADVARLSVVPLARDGGQAQFIVRDRPPPDGSALEPLLHWMEANCHRPLTLDEIAAQAMTSTRTLHRRFREQTGTTPSQWLHRARLRQAQYLLETTGHSVERIASQVGFGSQTAFRDRFRRLVGTSPQAYRRAFRDTAAG